MGRFLVSTLAAALALAGTAGLAVDRSDCDMLAEADATACHKAFDQETKFDAKADRFREKAAERDKSYDKQIATAEAKADSERAKFLGKAGLEDGSAAPVEPAVAALTADLAENEARKLARAAARDATARAARKAAIQLAKADAKDMARKLARDLAKEQRKAVKGIAKNKEK